MQHCAGFISAESLCRNKTCTVLHQVGVSFDLEYVASSAVLFLLQILFFNYFFLIHFEYIMFKKNILDYLHI